MNIPSAFGQIKRVVAEVMAYIYWNNSIDQSTMASTKRLLIAGLSQIKGFAISVMGEELGRAEETSSGRYRIVAEWNPSPKVKTPFGTLKTPLSALIQDDRGSVVARVLGEPQSGRMWVQGWGEQSPTLIVVSYIRPDTEIIVCRGAAMTPAEFAEFLMQEDEGSSSASA